MSRVPRSPFVWLLLVLLSCAGLVPGSGKELARPEVVASEFRWDAEGWTVAENAADWRHDGRGFLTATGTRGEPWYWSAPAALLGDQGEALGGLLTYELRDEAGPGPREKGPAVILEGGGLRLGCVKPQETTAGNWSVMSAPLRAGFWRNLVTGESVSDLDLAAALRSLDGLLIRGTRHRDASEGSLGRVAFTSGLAIARRARPKGVYTTDKVVKFKRQIAGDFAVRHFDLVNSTASPISVTIAVQPGVGAPGTFTTLAPSSTTLDAGGVLDISAVYRPLTIGGHSANIVIGVTGQSSLVVELSGSGVHPLEAQPQFKNYGKAQAGEEKPGRFTIRNLSIDTLRCTTSLVGDSASQFIHSALVQRSLDGGERFDAEVSYAPTSRGMHEAQLVVSVVDGDGNALPQLVISLKGKSDGGVPKLEMSSAPVAFGTSAPGLVVLKHLTLNNTGTGELEVKLPPSLPAPFAWLGTYPNPLRIAAHDAVDLDLEYRPTATGAHARSFTFQTNDRTRPSVTVQLQGSAVDNPQLLFDPEEVDFGSTASTFTEMTFEIINSSALELGVVVDQPEDPWDEWDVRLPADFRGALSPLEAVTVTVQFTPQFPGEHSVTTRVRAYIVGQEEPAAEYQIPLLGTYNPTGPRKKARPAGKYRPTRSGSRRGTANAARR